MGSARAGVAALHIATLPRVSDPVFISYAREDSDFALRLATGLRNAGLDVWLDQLSIRPGEPWDDAIETALTSASTLLLILSPDAVASKTVMDELGFALDEGKRIVPVLHRPCRVPLRIKRLHYADFTSTSPVQELAASLQSGAAFSYTKPRREKKRPRLKSALIAAAIGAVIGIGIWGVIGTAGSMDGLAPVAAFYGLLLGLLWAPAGAIVAGDRKRALWATAGALLTITLCVIAGSLPAALFISPAAAAAAAGLRIRFEN